MPNGRAMADARRTVSLYIPDTAYRNARSHRANGSMSIIGSDFELES
jgi:hypothetical protein